MDKQTAISPEYESPRRVENSLVLPSWAVAMCVLQIIWHFVMITGLYFLSPVNWHLVFFDHVLLRLAVYLLVALPAIVTCALTIATFRRFRARTSFRTLAIVMALVASSIAVPYLVWLFWVVVSPLDPHSPTYWV